MKTASLFAAAAAVVAAQSAAAQEACVPRGQAAQMAVSLVPALIDSAARACSTHLPAGAFLGSGSRALSDRLRADTATVRPHAVATILALTGQAAPAPGQDQDLMVQVLVDGFIADLDAAKCRGASEMLEALAPLPTANIVQALGAALGVAMAEADPEDAPAICRE